MLYSEIIAVCSQIHTKHINTLCGQNVEFLTVETSGTYSDHYRFCLASVLQVHKFGFQAPCSYLPLLPNILVNI
jgi:hypothetical protein